MTSRRDHDAFRTPGLFDAPPERAQPEPAPARDPAPPTGPRRLTVAELTDEIRARLGDAGRLGVVGELSNLRKHASGHVYFDLLDEGARLAGVVWRSRAAQAFRGELADGMRVVATGRLDVYAPRGSYSLVADRIEPVGLGELLAELERLKRELSELGWFERRRPLPALPRRIGLVTSKGGAALRDFLRTRSLRWAGYPVVLAHAAVQGPGAAREVAGAIARLDALGVDVIVVTRGGGSLEDLWAFNERAVAEAIHAASVPVVTGVGHETDTTLADLVADHRAHTPTDAAQTVVPDRAARTGALVRLALELTEAMRARLEGRAERLAALACRPVLVRPERILERRVERLRAVAGRAEALLRTRVERAGARLAGLEVGLARNSPWSQLERLSARLARLGGDLRRRAESRQAAADAHFRALAGRLESLSPLKVLARGYSLTTRPGELAPVRDAADLAPGEEVETRLARGSFSARVVEARFGDPEEGA